MSKVYQVLFPNPSLKKKFLKALDKAHPPGRRQHIMEAVRNLASDPRPYKSSDFRAIRDGLAIAKHTAQYRLRIGDYRILYDVDDTREIVWILALRKRDEGTYQ